MSDQDAHPAFILATRVIDARDSDAWFKIMQSFPLKDDDVHRLIRLAYEASLMEEEGRFPTARLVCSRFLPKIRFGNNPPRDSPQVHDADVLRRLAPIAKRSGSALAMFALEPGDIRCAGLFEFAEVIDPYSQTTVSKAWETGETLADSLFMIRIEVQVGFGQGSCRRNPFFLTAD